MDAKRLHLPDLLLHGQGCKVTMSIVACRLMRHVHSMGSEQADAHLVTDPAVLVLRIQPLTVPAAAVVLQPVLDLMLIEGYAAAGACWYVGGSLSILQDTF